MTVTTYCKKEVFALSYAFTFSNSSRAERGIPATTLLSLPSPAVLSRFPRERIIPSSLRRRTEFLICVQALSSRFASVISKDELGMVWKDGSIVNSNIPQSPIWRRAYRKPDLPLTYLIEDVRAFWDTLL